MSGFKMTATSAVVEVLELGCFNTSTTGPKGFSARDSQNPATSHLCFLRNFSISELELCGRTFLG